ncbi:nose resistant to fluoxetine protein 6-like [Xenia sp. Carnegie-2017]|uniref:nose resistant to fluoxetine protein 6-like n=1 Tax=Xenia sp. Carnegie-2017 TaxID=2897299 RepID=UPI001F03A6B3|nr:nose resistant to fluoxetine protein 6-like [Xenia sp. Carnegie-2017]
MAMFHIILRTSWFLALCFLYFGYSDTNVTTAQDVGITTTESPTGTFPNPNVVLTNLMDQLSNTTFFDLLKKLNSSTQSASQNAQLLKAISQSFRAMNPLSLFTTSVMNNLKSLNLGQCGKDLQMIANETAVMVKYIDAAGKPHSGLTEGNNYWGGAHEVCEYDIENAHVCGSLLLLQIPLLKLNMQAIFWTGCFPQSCTSDNASAILKVATNQVSELTDKAVEVYEYGTKCIKGPGYDTGTKLTMYEKKQKLILYCILWCIDASMLDRKHTRCYSEHHKTVEETGILSDAEGDFEMKANGKWTQQEDAVAIDRKMTTILRSKTAEVFLCFSLQRNTRKIFDTSVSSAAITSINGIRVISIFWIILGHVYLYSITNFYSVTNKKEFLRQAESVTVMAVANAYFAVDSFFFLSGLLVAYTCLRKMERTQGKVNWGLFYLHRYLRLTPSLMFVVLFAVHIKGILSDSPTWLSLYKEKNCEDKWWTNMLYINNFYPKEFNDQCIGWVWYLANDMQFYVISPILIVLAYRFGWRGLFAGTGALMAISTITIPSIYVGYDVDPLIVLKSLRPIEDGQRKRAEYNKYEYSKPYCRIQPYLVGFIIGYVIYKKYRNPFKKHGWLIAITGWCVAFAVAMTMVYGPFKSAVRGENEWTRGGEIVFGTLQRLLWGLAVAWVTYACHFGYGSYINEFLSARFWIPLSRLTYSVYLIHMIVIHYMLYAANGSMHYSIAFTVYYFLASVVLSFAGGYILAVVIEFPVENLEKLFLK